MAMIVSDRPKLANVNSLEELYEITGRMALTPGWISRPSPILKLEINSKYPPAHWPYRDAHDALAAAGRLIGVELAERRNLLLFNDAGDNDWATSRTLVCAYQMILPGEFAPSHRHTGNALRVIVEGEGTYSIVDGERTPMETGDVVLTPGGCWHGHGHDGDVPAYWLDCLDVPMSYLLERMRFTPPVGKEQPDARKVESNPYRFSRAEISRLLDAAVPDTEGRFGQAAELPTPSMPSIGLLAQRIEGGMTTRRRRTAANRLFAVMEGRGTTLVGDKTMTWERGDTLFIPNGAWFEHSAESDAQLLDMSDEPVMRFTNHYGEELA